MLLLPIADAPNFAHRRPWATWLLVAINVVVHVVAAGAHRGTDGFDRLLFDYGYVPLAPRLETWFTCMFLHGSWAHLGGNMLFLLIFGDNVEARLGSLGFLCAYLAAGLAALLVFHVLQPHSGVPLVGASGAIFGVQGIYFVAFPQNRVRFFYWFFFFGFFWVPARIVLGFFLVGDFVRLLLEQRESVAGGTVAYAAHVGGFAFGFLMALGILRFLPRIEPGRRSMRGAQGTARQLLEDGMAHGKQGRIDAARAAFATLARNHPHTPEAGVALLNLGWIALRHDGDATEATVVFEHVAASQTDPALRAAAAEGLAAAAAARG